MILMVGDILIPFWSTPVYSREICASWTKTLVSTVSASCSVHTYKFLLSSLPFPRLHIEGERKHLHSQNIWVNPSDGWHGSWSSLLASRLKNFRQMHLTDLDTKGNQQWFLVLRSLQPGRTRFKHSLPTSTWHISTCLLSVYSMCVWERDGNQRKHQNKP